jgi:hypothetical protein
MRPRELSQSVDVTQVARLEGLSEDDLMSLLGREVLSEVVGADQAGDEEKVEVGKNFFAEHRAELKRRLKSDMER